MRIFKTGFLALGLVFTFTQAAYSNSALWTDVGRNTVPAAGPALVQPTRSRSLSLQLDEFKTLLKSAPLERNTPAALSNFEIALPKVDGSFERFSVVESPIMEPGLARKYPQFRTYLGQSIDDPSATVRFDLTQLGFRAQILSWRGTSYIEPLQRGDTTHYLAFEKDDLPRGERTFSCGVKSATQESMNFQKRGITPKISSGTSLRTHRLAMAATGEYTAALGGTVADGLAGIITTMNRVNGIYEREVSVRMVLVANTDLLIYTNAGTDPYANDSNDLPANQANVDTQIGSANYDIGHLVGTGGGGVAALPSVCAAGAKAQGLTGSGNPTGDAFDVDFVAHEIGHQYSGNHTFNGAGLNCSGANRNGPTAYEPGSGITIQAYAGICAADNLQPNSEDYFHRVSLNEILAYTTTGGGNCGTTSATGNSPPAVPTISSPTGLTIPISTPFELNASTIDPNGDALTYIWEQFDLTAQQAVAGNVSQLVAGPLFRSFDPKPTGNRQLYPSLRHILNIANQPTSQMPIEGTTAPDFFSGERLPTTTRTLNFHITARDNRAGGGGTNEASYSVATTNTAGPFAVTAPNTTGISIAAGNATIITWSVANTTATPVSTANVRILLSRDGGYTFPTVLAATTANDGSESITIPGGTPATTQARIRIEAIGNIYFDINDNNFAITGTNTPPGIAGTATVSVRQGGPSVTNATIRAVSDTQTAAGTLTLSLGDIPRDLSVAVTNVGGNVSATASATCNAVAPTSGSKAYPILLNVTDADGAVTSGFFNVLVESNRAPTLGTYATTNIAAGGSGNVSPSAAPADPEPNLLASPMSVSPSTLPGGGTVAINNAGVVSISSTGTTPQAAYPIEVRATDICGAVEIRRFTLNVTNTNPVLGAAVATVLTGNGSIEPNECNQLRVAVSNGGAGTATAVTGTLSSSTPGISVTQASASYPNIAAAASAFNITPFEVSSNNSLVCASSANFTLTLNYTGGGSPAVLPIALTVGNTLNTVLNENFDSVVAPNLPAGWTTQRTGATPPAFFATTATAPNSAPNVAFTNGVATVASNSLISPSIALPAGAIPAVLSFSHAFNFEFDANGTYDGGIVEISTNGGTSFANVSTLGASFTTGGYNATIASGFGNPIAGQLAWNGVQATYVPVSLTLPASLNGQTILIRFRAGWDNSTVNANPNWRIDDVRVQAGLVCPGPGNGQCSGIPATPRGFAVGSVTLPATIAGINNATRVRFAQVFDQVPIVIAQGDDANTDPHSVRISSVTTTGFDLLQVEPAGANCIGCTGSGPAVTVHWLAAKPGSYRLPNDINARVPGPGVLVKVGSFNLTASQRSTSVIVGGFTGWPAIGLAAHTFPVSGTTSLNFSAAPVVLSGLQSWTSSNEGADLGATPVTSLNGASEVWLTPVLNSITANGFNAALESSTVDDNGGNGTGVVAAETLGYVAIENGVSTRIVDLAGSFVGLATGNGSVTGACSNVDLSFPTGVTINPVNLRALHSKNSRVEEDGGWVRRCNASNPSGQIVRSRARIDEDADVSADRSHTSAETVGTAIFGGDFVTTPVTLAYQSASRNADRLNLEFSAATEAGHIGYRVWGRVDSRADWAALHEDLIVAASDASSEAMQPAHYRKTFAAQNWNELRIEDIDLLGRSRFHAPIAVGASVGAVPQVQPLDWSAIRRSHAQVTVRNFANAANNGVIAAVRRAGIQRVAVSELIALGLPITAENVQALAVLDADAPQWRALICPSFPNQCELEWIAEIRDSLYGPERAYTIKIAQTAVRAARTGAAALGTAQPTQFIDTLLLAPNRAYSFSAPGLDPWFDQRLAATSAPTELQRSFTLPGRVVAGAAPVSLSVRLFGGLDFPGAAADHSVELWLNGSLLATRRFDGLIEQVIEATLADSQLRDENTLTLRLLADTGYPADVVALDGFSVRYLRQSSADAGKLSMHTFNSAGTLSEFADGFEAQSSPTEARFLLTGVQGASALWSQEGDQVYRDVVSQNVSLSLRTTALKLTPETALERPALFVAPNSAVANPIDYLIVSHPLFADRLGPLVQLQQSRGYSVRVVRTDEIYARANHVREPEAIRQFIAQSAPRFVLLVGGDSYDYADNLGVGSVSFIPTTYRVASPIVRFAPSDLPLVDFDQDGTPNAALGRLPVRTIDELDRALTSILQRGDQSATKFFASAGASSNQENFDIHSRALLSYLRQSQSKSFGLVDEIGLLDARSRAVQALSGDADWINYLGHSSPNRWAAQNLLDTNQLAGITRTGAPSIVSQWGCWNNYFVLPNQDTMAHALMLRSNRLSAAVLGSTSLAEDQSHLALGLKFFDLVEDGRFDNSDMTPVNTVGEALQRAKIELLRTQPEHRESSFSVTLFGDPAMPLR